MQEWNWEGGGEGVLTRIGRQLLYHPKLEASHGVELRVSGSLCCKYFPHRAEVSLHAVLLNRVYVGCNNPVADPL